MKKAVLAIIVCMAVILGACKEKTVINKYSIGCIGFSASSYNASDWTTLQDYFSSTVTYNTTVTFESSSESENDYKAKNLYNEQIKKLDTAYVCSLLNEPDFFIYGIYTLTSDSSYRVLGALRFEHNGTSESNQ